MNKAIKSRLTRDNFWNVLTWVAMPTSAYFSSVYGSLLWLIGSFTLLPYILAKFNNISISSLNKDVIILNKQGQALNIHLPFKLNIACGRFVLSIILTAILMNSFGSDKIDFALILFVTLWLPMSYFILNNIPVSTFFNLRAWNYVEFDQTPYVRSKSSSNSNVSSFNNDALYSPSRNYLLGNIYHHKK